MIVSSLIRINLTHDPSIAFSSPSVVSVATAIGEVLVVVFFAFVMVHVQLILSPWKCMECGDFRENPGRQYA